MTADRPGCCCFKNPAAFLTLLGKVLPLQMTGADDGPPVIKIVNYGAQ